MQNNWFCSKDPRKNGLIDYPQTCGEIYLISAKLALFLIFAISYLTCCFVVHHHHVPIGWSGVQLGLPFLHREQYHSQATSLSLTAWCSLPVSTIYVITTVAILIVYVALWPMNSVVNVIRPNWQWLLAPCLYAHGPCSPRQHHRHV